jgi:pimeloyl-ACP methyl ester carboxylesterase
MGTPTHYPAYSRASLPHQTVRPGMMVTWRGSLPMTALRSATAYSAARLRWCACLGLDRVDLLGHSAAGDLAVLYAAAHPQRVARLILLTPALRALGIEETGKQWRAALTRRSGEPWYPQALAAVEKAEAGDDTMETRRGYLPFLYGRWDAAARAHAEVGISERSRPVRDGYAAAGAFSPAVTRQAVGRLVARAGVRRRSRHQSHARYPGSSRAAVPERRSDRPARCRALPVAR